MVFLLVSLCDFIFFAQDVSNPLPEAECLFAVFKTLGVDSSIDEFKNLSNYEEGKDITLNGLSEVAKAKGLYSEVVKISLEELASLKTTAIIHLWDEEFRTIDKFEGDRVRVIAPNKQPLWIEEKKLADTYSGLALLISKNKSSFPQIEEIRGADIRFDEFVHDFGVVEGGKEVEHIFKIKNVGKKTLEILRVRSSCGCTAVVVSNRNIPPQGGGEVKAIFDTTGYRGFDKKNVYVQSNDTITPLVKLQIRGVIKTGEVSMSPKRIDFGVLRKEERENKKLDVAVVGDEDLKILKTETSSENLYIEISEVPDEYFKRFKVTVALSSNIAIGKLNEEITIYTNNEKYAEVEIPIIGDIRGDIEVNPSQAFFGLAGEIREKKLKVLNEGEKPLEIEKIDNPFDFLSVKIVPKVEGKEYELIFALEKGTPPEKIKGEVIICTNNPEQPKIKIPVYCLLTSEEFD